MISRQGGLRASDKLGRLLEWFLLTPEHRCVDPGAPIAVILFPHSEPISMEAKKQKDKGKQAGKSDDRSSPFFVLGCVRSGTTMLRDVLRLHPNLVAPEETHFFRWAEPFGTEGYMRGALNNPVLKKHRALDGVTEEEFAVMLKAAHSRADLYTRYMKVFMERRKPTATRWFDKTPQNVYGASMIALSVPRSRFVHIVRDPVNVVSSLRIGKIVKVERLTAAINYWREATDTMSVMKRAYPARVHEFRYEDFVRDMPTHIRALLSFLGEPYDAKWFEGFRLAESDHSSEGVLTDEEIARVNQLTLHGRRRYGYATPEELALSESAESAVS